MITKASLGVETKYIVSACLVGDKCRYDCGSCPNQATIDFLKDKDVLKICPEEMGGLPTPRAPSEIISGDGYSVLEGTAKVRDVNGEDRTGEFVKGAQAALAAAVGFGGRIAILKSKSPSCGVNLIYNGLFNGELEAGAGVTAALFKKNGITVMDEDELGTIG